jgi:hypothetical protein
MMLRNLKPSLLPEGTVIDDPRHGEYIKRAEGVWEEVGCDIMGDKYRVSDKGYNDWGDAEKIKLDGSTIDDKSDDYFKDYRVVAVDPSFCFYIGDLHGEWDHELQSYPDGAGYHGCKGYNCEA